MPLFDFKCIKCDAVVEKLLRMSDTYDRIRCLECKQGMMHKQVSLCNFTIKGYCYNNSERGPKK